MFKRCLKMFFSIYFVIAFVSIVICLGLIAVDCVNKASTGEYTIFPAFNFYQYKVGGTVDEQSETLLQVVAYGEQLYELGYGYDDPLWLLINFSTAIALCNLPLYYILHDLLDRKFSRYVRVFMLVGVAIALFFIVAARVFPKGTYAASQIKLRYPVAYLTREEIAIAAIVLIGLAVLKKLFEKE